MIRLLKFRGAATLLVLALLALAVPAYSQDGVQRSGDWVYFTSTDAMTDAVTQIALTTHGTANSLAIQCVGGDEAFLTVSFGVYIDENEADVPDVLRVRLDRGLIVSYTGAILDQALATRTDSSAARRALYLWSLATVVQGSIGLVGDDARRLAVDLAAASAVAFEVTRHNGIRERETFSLMGSGAAISRLACL